MEQKQNISQAQDRADGNRAVPRRSITLSERRVQKLYDDIHEAGMKVRVEARRKGVPGGMIDDLLFQMQMACCDAALASVRERI